MYDIFTSIWKRVAQEVITPLAVVCDPVCSSYVLSMFYEVHRLTCMEVGVCCVCVELLCDITQTTAAALFRILVASLLHQLTISSTKYQLQTNRICFYCHVILCSFTDWIVGVWW
jgi:hypothetical protein